MSRFCPLFSSSSGNSIYIGTASDGILIDVGQSAKRTAQALCAMGIDPASLRAVFVTHEHSDHVKGLRVFASQHRLPVYASNGTLAALSDSGCLCDKFTASAVDWNGCEITGMFIKPFHTQHDCREGNGYRIEMPDGRSIAVATDLGEMTREVVEAITGCDLVMLESNHDVDMLRSGSYPYVLKQRILSKYGHLSNEVCAQTLASLVNKGTTRFVLGHLSIENNIPQLAYDTSARALLLEGAKEGRDYTMCVAPRLCPEEVIIF
ncbi:MAG: MBL fold metallo-hydrolase [Clostridiales bacterium]|nr:MBL fold metallo-hydrolase [Clostridiales bacterium]